VIPGIPEWHDEPFADSSQVPTFLVCEMARAHVTVALSGDGGDGLFAGYKRYPQARKLEATLARVPAGLRPALAGTLARVPAGVGDPIAGLLARTGRWPAHATPEAVADFLSVGGSGPTGAG
jgi:asparagine synthase (glutamine-hydrolysing)